MERLLCLLVGYVCGGFLTAELVAKHCTGKSAAHLGTGNPGMANLAHELGTGWGAVVLAGDIAKKGLRQVVTALSDGAVAGNALAAYLRRKKRG